MTFHSEKEYPPKEPKNGWLQKQKWYAYTITIPCGIIIALPAWLLYRWGFGELAIFYFGWIIAHPLFKIWKKFDELEL